MESDKEKQIRLLKAAAKKGLHLRGLTLILPNDTTYTARDLADLASFIRDW